MITNAIEQVKEFADTFNIEYSDDMNANIDQSIIDLRFRLMQEENMEYLEAAKNKDIVEIADALGDILYILCGTILAHGLQHKIVEVFNEIQRSNMSKLDVNGKPVFREDGKILKGPNYFQPKIKEILDK
jgi:predicted HAD superfamily Cof-like phosphohydrolase